MKSKAATIEKPRIIDLDDQASKQPKSKTEHFVIQVDLDDGAQGVDAFLVVLGSTLSEHSDFVEKVLQHAGKPRMILVIQDTNVNSIIEKINMKPWRQLQSILFVFEQWSQVDRALQAWYDRQQDRRVAVASVEGELLKLYSCSHKPYEIEFSKLKSLSKIKKDDRSKFEIDEYGRHLFWPDYDLHIDIIDAIKYQTDERYKKERDIRDITRNSNYGAAIACLREKRDLTQKKVEEKTGLTDRQLRRVEREGHPISLEVAEKLAKAHGMKLEDYLQAVTVTLMELRKTGKSAAYPSKLEPEKSRKK